MIWLPAAVILFGRRCVAHFGWVFAAGLSMFVIEAHQVAAHTRQSDKMNRHSQELVANRFAAALRILLICYPVCLVILLICSLGGSGLAFGAGFPSYIAAKASVLIHVAYLAAIVIFLILKVRYKHQQIRTGLYTTLILGYTCLEVLLSRNYIRSFTDVENSRGSYDYMSPNKKQEDSENPTGIYYSDTGVRVEYHQNGKVASKARLYKGKMIDSVKFYHSNGNLNWESWRDSFGREQGLFRLYHRDGSLSQEGLHVDGNMQGLWKLFYPGGTLKAVEYYKKNKRDSIWFYYNERGRKTKEEVYRNDSLISSTLHEASGR